MIKIMIIIFVLIFALYILRKVAEYNYKRWGRFDE